MPEFNHILDLLKKIGENDDRKAFEIFFKHYHSKLIRFSLMFVPNYQDAEDVVSEVMIKLLRQRHKLAEIENFEGYLFLAIKNQSLNYKRRNIAFHNSDKEIPQDYLTDSFSQPFEKIIEEELRHIITRTVESLPAQRRMVYKLIKDDGLKCKEVAELLNIAEKTVKKHLELAIKDLKETIKEYYEEKQTQTPVINISNSVGGILLFLSSLYVQANQ